jgi:hypothetical protein
VSDRLVATPDVVNDAERRHRRDCVREEQDAETVGAQSKLPDPRLLANEVEIRGQTTVYGRFAAVDDADR